MTRIAFIGAGSVELRRNLLGDILSFPELADAEIVLHDINEERLETAAAMARWTSEAVGARPDQRAARAPARPRRRPLRRRRDGLQAHGGGGALSLHRGTHRPRTRSHDGVKAGLLEDEPTASIRHHIGRVLDRRAAACGQ